MRNLNNNQVIYIFNQNLFCMMLNLSVCSINQFIILLQILDLHILLFNKSILNQGKKKICILYQNNEKYFFPNRFHKLIYLIFESRSFFCKVHTVFIFLDHIYEIQLMGNMDCQAKNCSNQNMRY